jgi:taurine dioxygenase
MRERLDVEETTHTARTEMGAIIHGLDVSSDLSTDTTRALREVALKFPVVVIPNQTLSPEGLTRFARNFGELQPHTAERYRHPEFPELSYISNVDREGKQDQYGQNQRASGWHSDGSFLARPYSFTMLYGVEVPSTGGATLFSNTYLAYERLPDDIKAEVDDAIAVHAIGSGPDGAGSPSRMKRLEQPELFPDIPKPIVSTHPETGRRSLYINPMHTSHIISENEARAKELFNYLIDFCVQEEFVYEHKWRANDIVIWDQRCTLHRAGGGVPSDERRVMLRALVKGLDSAS